jgi:hypothetical protein
MIYFGKEGEFNIIVMELLGGNLEDMIKECGRRFSLKSVLLIADQIVNRRE